MTPAFGFQYRSIRALHNWAGMEARTMSPFYLQKALSNIIKSSQKVSHVSAMDFVDQSGKARSLVTRTLVEN